MNNKTIFIFLAIVICLTPFLSSQSLGISPEKIILSAKPNERICKNFTLLGEEESIFNGELKWSKENIKDIDKYSFSSEELNINADFPTGINFGEYQICLSAKKSGNYFGALMYKLESSSYGIGIWIELTVKNNNIISDILILTGDVIAREEIKKVLLFTPIIFLIILFLLLKKLKAKDNKNI